jgi:hypothetical protein
MVPDRLFDYFMASLGASAALIGLLFVAVSIAPERVFGARAGMERRAIAVSAFLALLNAFYISLVALIPTANIGYVALVMALVALVETASIVRRIWEDGRKRGTPVVPQLSLVWGSFVMYTIEIVFAVELLGSPRNTDYVYDLAYLLIASYSLGVGHAWRLLGAPDEGLFTLLGLHHDQDADQQDEGPAPAGESRPSPPDASSSSP